MLTDAHNRACVDRYAATGVLESERIVPSARPCRGTCPECGGNLYSDCHYVSGRGYLIVWTCETCTWSKVI